MSNLSQFDHLQTTDNPAIFAARKLYKDIKEKRDKKIAKKEKTIYPRRKKEVL